MLVGMALPGMSLSNVKPPADALQRQSLLLVIARKPHRAGVTSRNYLDSVFNITHIKAGFVFCR